MLQYTFLINFFYHLLDADKPEPRADDFERAEGQKEGEALRGGDQPDQPRVRPVQGERPTRIQFCNTH